MRNRGIGSLATNGLVGAITRSIARAVIVVRSAGASRRRDNVAGVIGLTRGLINCWHHCPPNRNHKGTAGARAAVGISVQP